MMTPYEEGIDAYLSRVPMKANWYEYRSEDWYDWRKGWEDADFEAKVKLVSPAKGES